MCGTTSGQSPFLPASDDFDYFIPFCFSLLLFSPSKSRMTSCSGFACKSRSSLLAMHASSPLNGRGALPVGRPIARILTGCHRSVLWLSLLILHKPRAMVAISIIQLSMEILVGIGIKVDQGTLYSPTLLKVLYHATMSLSKGIMETSSPRFRDPHNIPNPEASSQTS